MRLTWTRLMTLTTRVTLVTCGLGASAAAGWPVAISISGRVTATVASASAKYARSRDELDKNERTWPTGRSAPTRARRTCSSGETAKTRISASSVQAMPRATQVPALSCGKNRGHQSSTTPADRPPASSLLRRCSVRAPRVAKSEDTLRESTSLPRSHNDCDEAHTRVWPARGGWLGPRAVWGASGGRYSRGHAALLARLPGPPERPGAAARRRVDARAGRRGQRGRRPRLPRHGLQDAGPRPQRARGAAPPHGAAVRRHPVRAVGRDRRSRRSRPLRPWPARGGAALRR